MFHRSCDKFETMDAGDAVQRVLKLVLIGGCEAKHWLEIVIVMQAQLSWARG